MAAEPPPITTNPQDYSSITQQQTMPFPAIASGLTDASRVSTNKRTLKRVVGIAVALSLVIIMYFIWISPASAGIPTSSGSGITQQNFGGAVTASTSSSSVGGNIQVYIVGAVKHPGVYTLAPGARIYALLQAAGGPLPKANLVALNLAATLTDGEEVYVTVIGEVPPTYMGGVPGPSSTYTSGSPTVGQMVNINTASVDEMRQNLHVSSTTAQNIVNYRLQHGPFTSVDQLLQVVSRSIYDKIKGQVTI